MSNPISLDHIEWINDENPSLCAENLNKNQTALDACVTVADNYESLEYAKDETLYNYPNSRYLLNSSILKDATTALREKGVDSTGLFGDMPDEIRSISTGNGKCFNFFIEKEVYAEFYNPDGVLDLPSVDPVRHIRYYTPFGNGEGVDYISNVHTVYGPGQFSDRKYTYTTYTIIVPPTAENIEESVYWACQSDNVTRKEQERLYITNIVYDSEGNVVDYDVVREYTGLVKPDYPVGEWELGNKDRPDVVKFYLYNYTSQPNTTYLNIRAYVQGGIIVKDTSRTYFPGELIYTHTYGNYSLELELDYWRTSL